jgi:hypothetical protein
MFLHLLIRLGKRVEKQVLKAFESHFCCAERKCSSLPLILTRESISHYLAAVSDCILLVFPSLLPSPVLLL